MTRVLLSAGMMQQGRTGIAQHILGLLEALAQQPDIELVVAGLARDRHHFEHLQTLEWVDIPSWATHPLLNLAWHQTFLVILLRRLRIKVLHIPSYRRVVAFPTCPQVVTVHDCAAFSCKGKYDFLRHLFGSRILPPLIRRAARVIAVSETTRSDVRKYLGVPEIRIQTIPNGVQSIFFKECSEGEIQNRLAALGVSRPFFLYVSRLEHPAKNHVGLVEAFEIFKKRTGGSHQLVFAGADWHGANFIRQRVQESFSREEIRLLGFVDQEDLPVLYGAAEALVFPSVFEGFGLPPIEAMACGCPVLASHSGALGEIAGPASLPIDPRDSEQMARTMEQVCDAQVKEIWTARGRQHAARFSWDEAARRTRGLYREVCR